jgi:hypothetical protein
MANRKRTSHQAEPRNEEPAGPAEDGHGGEPPVVEKKPDPPSGKGKDPLRLISVMWGLPLLLFIVVAILKQCVWE